MSVENIVKERLIIFTRYPEPGKTKTRLIPALGAEQAALLQRQMTEHTLTQVRKLHSVRPIAVEVRFAGGDLNLMTQWLGSGDYKPQGEGDLGSRMARSLCLALEDNVNAVIIGTDCPGLKCYTRQLRSPNSLTCLLIISPLLQMSIAQKICLCGNKYL